MYSACACRDAGVCPSRVSKHSAGRDHPIQCQCMFPVRPPTKGKYVHLTQLEVFSVCVCQVSGWSLLQPARSGVYQVILLCYRSHFAKAKGAAACAPACTSLLRPDGGLRRGPRIRVLDPRVSSLLSKYHWVLPNSDVVIACSYCWQTYSMPTV